MRYSKKENTYLAGKLPTGGTVTISIIDPSDDSLVSLTSNICNESAHIPGMYVFNFTDNATVGSSYKNYLYQMSDGENTFIGKFVYAGITDDLMTTGDYHALK